MIRLVNRQLWNHIILKSIIIMIIMIIMGLGRARSLEAGGILI